MSLNGWRNVNPLGVLFGSRQRNSVVRRFFAQLMKWGGVFSWLALIEEKTNFFQKYADKMARASEKREDFAKKSRSRALFFQGEEELERGGNFFRAKRVRGAAIIKRFWLKETPMHARENIGRQMPKREPTVVGKI